MVVPTRCYDSEASFLPHTDLGFITVAPRGTIPGLWVATADGWVDIETTMKKDDCLIFAGNLLEWVTNGDFRSLIHRVGPSSQDKHDDATRLSMPFFLRGNPGCELVQRRSVGSSEGARATVHELMAEERRQRHGERLQGSGMLIYGAYMCAQPIIAQWFPSYETFITPGRKV